MNLEPLALELFTRAYKECALWTEEEEIDTSLYFNTETLLKMNNDCKKFVEQAGDLLDDWFASDAGHDFWLTRNGHGAGFWDRETSTGETSTEDNRTALSKLASSFGESTLYENDGEIHCG